MRVIAGTFRSRLLSAPPGTETRPTSDRLRETLFNILGPHVSGCNFADLYAGTGAVGIEAISRGAKHVFFAENSPASLRVLRTNLSRLGIHGGYAIEDRGTARLLERFAQSADSLDVVYLDPPYEAEQEYASAFAFFASPAGRKVLAPDGQVIVEHATHSRFPLPQQQGCLTLNRTLRQGDSTLSFYRTACDV